MNVRSPVAVHPNSFSPSYQNGMIAIRPPHEPYRSMPGTPLGMDHTRMDARTRDITLAMDAARLGLDGPDYFSGGGQKCGGGHRSRSPFLEDYDEGFLSAPYGAETCPLGLINRTNLAAGLLNSQIPPTARYAKIYPHMCDDGRFPADFSIPKTVETVKIFDNSQLDRIMQAYRLPLDLRTLGIHAHAQSNISSSRARQAKSHALLEYLGAVRLLEHERLRCMRP